MSMRVNTNSALKNDNMESPKLRRLPYPYKAAVSICNDIDETSDIEHFVKITEFLCTKRNTSLGRGLGLRISNTFFPFHPSDVSLMNGTEKTRQVIVDFIRSGLIDCMHSYGEKEGFSRRDASMVLEYLTKKDCYIETWVDHSRNVSNIGIHLTKGEGANKSSDAYHLDLTRDYGIKFYWLGSITRFPVQETNLQMRHLSCLFETRDNPWGYLREISKESCKVVLGKLGIGRFVVFGSNKLIHVCRTQDGSRIYEFIRACYHPSGVGTGATAQGLRYSISPNILDFLVDCHGISIIYTHLAKSKNVDHPFQEEDIKALRLFKTKNETGEIWIATTSELLNFLTVRDHIAVTQNFQNETLVIDIGLIHDQILGDISPNLKNIGGLTIYIPNISQIDVRLMGRTVKGVLRNPPDESGAHSISLPFSEWGYPL